MSRENVVGIALRASSSLFSIFSGAYLFALYAVSIILVVALLSAMQIKRAMVEANAFNVENLREIEGTKQARVSRIYDELYHGDKLYQADRSITVAAENVAATHGGFQEKEYIDTFSFFFPAEFESLPQIAEVKAICAGPDRDAHDVCLAWADYVNQLANKARLFESGEAGRFAEFEAQQLAKIREINDDQPFSQFADSLTLLQAVPQFERVISLPVEVLTLLLIMVMGLLGSIITMTWSFVKQDENLAARRFLIMPFIGSMSALVVLIFVKAGQLTVNAGDASVPLDLFFVSFLGIVSGMLSERAYAKISSIGTEFFATGEDIKRWAIRLDDAMKQAGLDPVQVSSLLGIPEDQVREIVTRVRSADPQQQVLLAAALRMRKADLFSDLPPA